MEIIDYIQNNLRAYAMKMTEWKYDADDFVQETTLQFLSHDYSSFEIRHQKNLAKKIMRNLFLINDIKKTQQRILFYKAGNSEPYSYPTNNIDFNALQLFLKERNDYQVNIFWLFNIGYTAEELINLFSLKKNTFYSMIQEGRKKMKKIITGECVRGKEATRLNWNERRNKIPFMNI